MVAGIISLVSFISVLLLISILGILSLPIYSNIVDYLMVALIWLGFQSIILYQFGYGILSWIPTILLVAIIGIRLMSKCLYNIFEDWVGEIGLHEPPSQIRHFGDPEIHDF